MKYKMNFEVIFTSDEEVPLIELKGSLDVVESAVENFCQTIPTPDDLKDEETEVVFSLRKID